MTRDAPPVFASLDADTPVLPERDGIHHAEFGRTLMERGDPLGLDCMIDFHGEEARQDALDAFIMEQFRAAQPAR